MLVRLATEFRGCATLVAWIRGAEAGERVFGLIAGVCYASSALEGLYLVRQGCEPDLGGTSNADSVLGCAVYRL